MTNPLNNYRILIADADIQLSKVLKGMLGEMGFTNVQMTRSGKDAFEQLSRQHFDFLITEWNTQHIDGISLISQIRRNPPPPNPTIPIIMLTGRAEQMDVATARDCGINEYVVKPFSAKTLYSRLERIVEKPRSFIITPGFVGPDRRNKGQPPPGVANRRTLKITAREQPKEVRGALTGTIPTIWNPNYSLKQKLGAASTLAALITPEVLSAAQASIDAITTDSLLWIKEDMAQMKALHQAMRDKSSPLQIKELSEIALTINSRAGTFGYGLASKVAYMLYLFCRNYPERNKPGHHVVIQKHIELLQVILGSDPMMISGKQGDQIMMDLHNLAVKYAA